MTTFTITIPGDPVPQGRGKAARWKAKDGREGLTVRDPTKSKNWKAMAKYLIYQALTEKGFKPPLFGPGVPVHLSVCAFFTCPKSDHRKREPRPCRPHTKRGDLDNIVKALQDAATGILFVEDCQVQRVTASKWIAPQGEAGYLWLMATEADQETP
jgi:Holliday junction resolvase RusA-like endonuclease